MRRLASCLRVTRQRDMPKKLCVQTLVWGQLLRKTYSCTADDMFDICGRAQYAGIHSRARNELKSRKITSVAQESRNASENFFSFLVFFLEEEFINQ